MSTSIGFAPHVSLALLWVLAGLSAALAIYLFAVRARGAWARALALFVAVAALANPLIVRETRAYLPDVVALVVDHSQSMSLNGRQKQADDAAARIEKELSADKSLVVRKAIVAPGDPGEDTGTQLFAAAGNALSDTPPERVAGVIALTDGEVHDVPPKTTLKAPFQAIIVGKKDERDRKLTIVSASRFAIVGHDADIALRVDDYGAEAGGSAEVDVRIDGVNRGSHRVEIGKTAHIDVPIAHGGENVVELSASPGPAELTLENNRAVVTVSGVRDRLRVLLISGEPHAGERVWRNLLKSDPSVDLVHFTILRPLEKQDATPIDQLALIEFPTRELFVQKLDQFDLIIFDRYRERGILQLAYFVNIARYVEDGGALLLAGGPELSGPFSIYRTPLAAILPARPTGQVTAGGFRPEVTDTGQAHPVTHDLPGANTPKDLGGKPPTWGRWFRLIDAQVLSGETLMSGPQGKPLLVLDHTGKGRVAEFLSDQEWLWARGFDGGGPQQELLRRLAHWLMKEPELEEERLSAAIVNGRIEIARHTMADTAGPVTVTYPSGKDMIVPLTKADPGDWKGSAPATELGLYRLSDGKLNAVTAAGPLNPKEVADMRATGDILQPVAQSTGGSVHWLSDGLPSIRRTDPGGAQSGGDWIGLKRNGAYRVTAVEQQALLPPWAALILLLGVLLLAWRVEGR